MKLKIAFIIFLFAVIGIIFTKTVSADTATDNALNFLKSKQDATGRITTGFSAPSQWSAIAFTENNIDVATVKNPTVSLQDFLVTDVPASPSAATDWEPRILAIVASGADPTNFGGINYVSNLQSFYTSGQLGDTCTLNDDIFGLLALIASGPAADTQIKQDVLQFLISKQDTTDGGFGFSAPGCLYYATSADMTGAGLQALVEAKNNGLTNPGLDSAIDKAKAYLFANQDADGGFGYYGSSDTDTTGWVLQAFNVLGMQNSDQATKARNYLLSQQSATDGGIMAFDYVTSAFVSNASTTAQALIALAGKSWIVRIFDPSTVVTVSVTPTITPTISPTDTPTMTPTPTPTPGSSSNNSSSTPTPTPASNAASQTPTPTPTPDSTTLASLLSSPVAPTAAPEKEENEVIKNLSITPEPSVLGTSDEKKENGKGMFIAGIFAGLGLLFIFIYLAKPFIIRKFK